MEFVGRNSIEKLSGIVNGQVLLFTQENIYNIFKDKLALVNPIIYTKISENPKREEIQQAEDTIKGDNFDSIVAFGGGSVIDFAKAFRFYTKRNVPLIAIPSTAGTGSQATQFAVVYVNHEKTSLDDKSIKPDHVIVDSQFVEHAPHYLKACCAMDAYCQAIESFWAKQATPESQKYALEAVKLCHEYLEKAVNTFDPVINEKMALAAHLAGKAINISRTTAAHALSYKITSLYGIPHGHAVALNIAELFVYNAKSCNVDSILDILQIDKIGIIPYFDNLMARIGLETCLEKLGITDVDAIVDSVNVERLKNNPTALTKDDLRSIVTRTVENN